MTAAERARATEELLRKSEALRTQLVAAVDRLERFVHELGAEVERRTHAPGGGNP
ncbi:hypothetical protein ACL02T_32885 [Pseudonocardia sp. RS010]|uniref:hypothetical protein n=1 Tax=Pseudonocardia sp. RS010 TaxID=3385979 RepID=UPI0039A10028